jgi:antitoxin ParD1/3/4
MSMTISLPDSFGEWLRSRVATGHYASVSDYVRDLISCDQAGGTSDTRLLADLAASVALGLDDRRAGRGRDAARVFDRLTANYESLALERSTCP